MASKNALWARYLNYKTGFSRNANQYATVYLSCSVDSGAGNLVLTNRATQPPYGALSPMTYAADSSISFETEYTSLPTDEFETSLGTGATPTGNAMCALDPPVTYLAPIDTTTGNPCQSQQDQATFIGKMLFNELQDSLIANFDSLYRAKCLSAQNAEVFYATYQPAEYHYTLYYYDQAGNLVKTLPPAAVRPNFDPAYLAAVPVARAGGQDMTNGANIENLATQYRYNTLNQVILLQTPDGGQSKFWYDRLGRLAVSQNAKQAGDPSYSYTLYDPLGRITEVGQKPQNTVMTQAISQDTTALANWLNDQTNGGTKVQITRTFYDLPSNLVTSEMTGLNLRNRVAYTAVIDADNTNVPPYRAATFYSYDPHGNVDTLLQDYGNSSVMGSANNRFKLMVYDYDLVSGKVNQVRYQPGSVDGFIHRYSYDAENRITGVRTSTDSVEWQQDACYTYYRHGPLARVQLGDLQVQGVDYAYTVQGWLKSINPSAVTPSGSTDQYDSDGVSSPALFERDAYKLTLNYFDDGAYTDYTPIAPLPGYVQGNQLPSAAKHNLYNGNISSMAVDIRQLGPVGGKRDAGPMLYNYGYDQLNRIAGMDAWAADGTFKPAGASPMPDYAERYTYDPNGNILRLNRNGDSTGVAMDKLTYLYWYAQTGGGMGVYTPGSAPTSGVDHLTNRLAGILDSVTGNSYAGDIKNQLAFNYQYDAIGELTGDVQAEISNIAWNVYGKILNFSDSGNTFSFTYDPAGNRISKTAHGITTWYVRDAQGNVMSVYTQGNSAVHGDSLTQTEADLYGSSRLGLLNLNVNCGGSLSYPTSGSLVRGAKLFELSNHLGNVLATISDKKLQHTSDNSTVDYYTADVINANDYYPGGMLMPGRTFNAGSYAYGYNGKRYDNEVYGVGNFMDYGMRMYDPRIVRFPSVDPLTKKYPWYSPYQYAGNKPVWKRDVDGLEEEGEEGREADKDELLKREGQVELGNALKSEPGDPKEELKKLQDDEKDPLRNLRRLKQALSNYGRNGFNTAQSIFGGTANIKTAVDEYILRQRGLPPSSPTNSQLQNSTALEEEVKVDAALARITPGTVTGKGKAIVGQWLRGTSGSGNAGFVPEAVAQKLRGQNFKSFDDFRAAFWKAVANTPELAKQFEPRDQALMKKGFAPYPVKEQANGKQRTYQLHHITPIQRGGAVYDVDNIMVVTPAYHKEVLTPTYHY